MKGLYRILALPFVVGLLAATGMVLAALPAFAGDQIAVALLLGIALAWLGLAIVNGRGWKRSNDGWHRALSEWGELQKLTADLTSLLSESLDNLSTYDRETADEILERTNTIILLRVQNLSERSKS